MRFVTPKELCHVDVNVRELQVFPESWTKRHDFSLYEHTPRPLSALFLVCTDICVTFLAGNKEETVAHKGDVVWIPTGTQYRVYVEGGNEHRIDTYTLNFRLLDENSEELLLSDQITVLAHRDDNLAESHADAICEAMSPMKDSLGETGGSRLRIKAEFYELLDTLSVSKQDHSDAYYPIRVGAEALRKEWNQNKKIEEYALLCGVSPAYFYRCFRRWSGKSPVEYRNSLRLFHAQTMLKHTDMRIGEISDTVGFEDPFYFCRLFSKQFGIAPKEYRKQQNHS